MTRKIAPLPGSFMITAIIGFLVSAVYIFPRSMSWGTAFSIVFIIMFIAAMISTRKAPIEAALEAEKRDKMGKTKK